MDLGLGRSPELGRVGGLGLVFVVHYIYDLILLGVMVQVPGVPIITLLLGLEHILRWCCDQWWGWTQGLERVRPTGKETLARGWCTETGEWSLNYGGTRSPRHNL